MLRKTLSPADAPTLLIMEVLSEVISFFSSPARVLLVGLLCTSWGLRNLPKVLAGNSDDRNGAFQVLADGTQDIAALVGLFATDSVERYSVDYSKGYLSVAAATCSLLGILGYVRALVKLAMGPQSCQDSAFPTAPVRSILGVAESDRLPKEELYTVKYITRRTTEGFVKFKIVKGLDHTLESFPAAAVMPIGPGSDPGLSLYMSVLRNWPSNSSSYPRYFRKNWKILAMTWGALLVTAAATSFPVISVSLQLDWTWTRIIASFGTFFALAVSSIMWSYVYVKEQKSTDLSNLGSELSKFAIIHPAQQSDNLVICDLQAVTGSPEWIFRALSLLTAAMISLGYICQYIEIRKTTTTQAARWLGTQTALAILRLLIWIWDPKFDDYKSFARSPVRLSNNFEAQEFAITMFSIPRTFSWGKDLCFPKLLLERLEQEPVLPMLKQAKAIASGGIPERIRKMLLEECTATWEFPEYLFSRWLAYRGGNIQRIEDPSELYGCIIVNIGGPGRWVGGEIILVPVLGQDVGYRRFLPTSPDGFNRSFNRITFDPFPTKNFYLENNRLDSKPTYDRYLAALLKELSGTIEKLEGGPLQLGKSENDTLPPSRSSNHQNQDEIVIDMENATGKRTSLTKIFAPSDTLTRRTTITSRPLLTLESI